MEEAGEESKEHDRNLRFGNKKILKEVAVCIPLIFPLWGILLKEVVSEQKHK